MNVPYFDAIQVCQALDYKQLIPLIEDTLGKFSSDSSECEVDQPLRATVKISKHDGFLSAMPAYVGSALACKLVSFYPENAIKGIPTHQATVLLFDEATGRLKACMDGEVITAKRTAAVSVVATKYLAQATETLAVLGSGVQARSHIEAFLTMFPFTKVNVWNHRRTGGEALARQFENRSAVFRVFADVADCVAEADVIVCATFATEPVLEAVPMKPWVHINAVGAPRPDWREMSSQLMTSCTVYVDSRASAAAESGDVVLSGAEIFAEIGHVVLGLKEARRSQPTIFKSLGLAVEDAVSAQLVYETLTK